MSALSPSSNGGTYVYCVVRSEPFQDGRYTFNSRAIGGRGDPVYTVHFMDLASIVSESPAPRYDIARANTMAHQLVIEEAMTQSDILPVRFGTVARGAQEVQEKLLQRKFGELQHLLRFVQDRVEVGLKVFWNPDRLFAEVVNESSRIRALRDAIAGKSPEESHYQRIQLGQLTEEAIVHKRDAEAEGILQELRPLAVETRVNKILTDTMVLNAAFLVDKACEWDFDAKVSALSEAHTGRLILKYVGPLPPYNFVSVRVHWGED